MGSTWVVLTWVGKCCEKVGPADWANLFFCLLWWKPVVFYLWFNSWACPSKRNASPWKSTSEPVKSSLGVGRYSDMAVSPTRSHLLCMKALVVPRGYSWAFTIRPNDLREDRLPRDITEGIHWLVSTRYLFRTRNSTYQFLILGQNNVRGQNVKKCSFELF